MSVNIVNSRFLDISRVGVASRRPGSVVDVSALSLTGGRAAIENLGAIVSISRESKELFEQLNKADDKDNSCLLDESDDNDSTEPKTGSSKLRIYHPWETYSFNRMNNASWCPDSARWDNFHGVGAMYEKIRGELKSTLYGAELEDQLKRLNEDLIRILERMVDNMLTDIRETALERGEDGLRKELQRLGISLLEIRRRLGIGEDQNLMNFLEEIMQLLSDRFMSFIRSPTRSVQNTSATAQGREMSSNGESSPPHESIALSHEIKMSYGELT